MELYHIGKEIGEIKMRLAALEAAVLKQADEPLGSAHLEGLGGSVVESFEQPDQLDEKRSEPEKQAER